MVHIERQLIVMTEYVPVGKVSNQADQPGSALVLQLLNSHIKMLLFDVGGLVVLLLLCLTIHGTGSVVTQT